MTRKDVVSEVEKSVEGNIAARQSIQNLIRFIDVGRRLGKFSRSQESIWKPAINKLEKIFEPDEEDAVEYICKDETIETLRRRFAEREKITGSTLNTYINGIRRIAKLYIDNSGDASKISSTKNLAKAKVIKKEDQNKLNEKDQQIALIPKISSENISFSYPLSDNQIVQISLPKNLSKEDKNKIETLFKAILESTQTQN